MNEITRYHYNRKLYCSGNYVNLEYILDLIRGQEQYRITDSETNEDVTREVTQRAVAMLLGKYASNWDLVDIVHKYDKKRRAVTDRGNNV